MQFISSLPGFTSIIGHFPSLEASIFFELQQILAFEWTQSQMKNRFFSFSANVPCKNIVQRISDVRSGFQK
jgi:hypothetical protein